MPRGGGGRAPIVFFLRAKNPYSCGFITDDVTPILVRADPMRGCRFPRGTGRDGERWDGAHRRGRTRGTGSRPPAAAAAATRCTPVAGRSLAEKPSGQRHPVGPSAGRGAYGVDGAPGGGRVAAELRGVEGGGPPAGHRGNAVGGVGRRRGRRLWAPPGGRGGEGRARLNDTPSPFTGGGPRGTDIKGSQNGGRQALISSWKEVLGLPSGCREALGRASSPLRWALGEAVGAEGLGGVAQCDGVEGGHQRDPHAPREEHGDVHGLRAGG